MKKLSTTIIFILLSNLIYSQNNISNLIIEKGETKRLTARSYTYKKVHIKTGATLEFSKESSTWAVINCEEFILDGNIISNQFKRGIGNIKTTTNDGFLLEYKFTESSRGGNGGHGGDVDGGGGNFEGKGFRSKNQNGGGGGAGTQENIITSSHGDDAKSYKGALSTFNNTKYSSGGDGAKSNNNHGGLLCLNTINFNSNENSWIYLNGENGENGKNGKPGLFLFDDNYSAGGGGGGSAGGDGGVLIVRANKYMNQLPKVNVTAGFGGGGGKGGDAFQPYGFGLNGKKGEKGKNGFIHWLQK